MPGLAAWYREPRIEAPDLVVEGASPLARGRREDLAQGEEAGFDLSPGALSAVVGALARGSLPLQPLGLRPQSLLPLEEGGVLEGVVAYRRSRLRGERRVRRPVILPEIEEFAEHPPGGSWKGT